MWDSKGEGLGNKEATEELTVLDIISLKMNDGVMTHDIQLNSNQRKHLNNLVLLMDKPTLYAANVSENEIIQKKQNLEIQKLFNIAQERGKCSDPIMWKI